MESSDHTRGSVLVVDDEQTITEVVSRYLERAGYEVNSAGDGPQALAQAALFRPDLVVLDLMLPGIDGLGWMRGLRDVGQDLAAITLRKARGGEEDRVVALGLGA